MPTALELIHADWHPIPGVRAFATTRAGGVSEGCWAGLNLGGHVGDDPHHVAENRARLRAKAGLPAEPLWLDQVHGTVVADDAAPVETTADARYTDQPGRVCAVLSADCLPLLLASAAGDEVAAVHAGWRGLASGIVERAVARFRAPPQRLRAWLGPAIGPDAYRVGAELRAHFPAVAQSAFVEREHGLCLDLYTAARALLAAAGVKAMHGGGWCTAGDRNRFFSHRRDGVTGRIGSFIWFRDPAVYTARAVPSASAKEAT